MKHKVRFLFGKNEMLKKYLMLRDQKKYIRKSRLRTLARAEAFRECYELHRAEFQKLYELLEDDFSRRTLHNVIEYRLTARTC